MYLCIPGVWKVRVMNEDGVVILVIMESARTYEEFKAFEGRL